MAPFIVVEDKPVLTPTQLHILARVGQGRTDKQIAHEMKGTVKTISNHMTRILENLNAGNRTHAVITAMWLGYLRFKPHEEVTNGLEDIQG